MPTIRLLKTVLATVYTWTEVDTQKTSIQVLRSGSEWSIGEVSEVENAHILEFPMGYIQLQNDVFFFVPEGKKWYFDPDQPGLN